MLVRLSLFMLGVSLCACLDDADRSPSPGGSVDTIETIDQAINSNCPAMGCGSNSPEMGNGIAFHELDLDGAANDVGVRVGPFAFPSEAAMTLMVDGHHLRGRTPAGRTVQYGALVGAELELRHAKGNFKLKIASVGEVGFWFGAVSLEVPVYTFLVRPANSEDKWQPLCKGLGLGHDPQWRGIQQIAIVFRGDRYDGVHKRVIATGAAAGGWFNIACAGSAIAKLHLMRHTDAGSNATYTTTVDERTAMLKMFAADYCGNGHAFTVAGQPLWYTDAHDWYPLGGPTRTIESVWSPYGAKCLDAPRLLATNARLRDEIRVECGGSLPPPCAPILGHWKAIGSVLSTNP